MLSVGPLLATAQMTFEVPHFWRHIACSMHDRQLQRASMEHQERPGATIDNAIKIVADWSEDAIDLENEHISRLFGLRGRDWNKRAQFLVFREGRRFDRILI